MTKIRFENSPSTNTPINANNLNKLNNVVISKTTPTTGEEVWIKKGKNLFDSSTIVSGDITDAYSNIRLSSRQNIWLEAGTYTFSTNLSSDYQFALSINNVSAPPIAAYPDYIYNSSWHEAGTTKKTFTISNVGWFVLSLRRADNSDISLNDVTSFNYQLESGDSATDYEAYIVPKIYAKAANIYESLAIESDSNDIIHGSNILSDILNNHFYGYDDTTGEDIKELLRNKMEYGKSLCTRQDESVVFGGGWNSHNYGLSIYSHSGWGKYQHLIFISTDGIRMCRNLNGTYTYYTMSWTTLT